MKFKFKFSCIFLIISIGLSNGNDIDCKFEMRDFATIGQQYTCVVQNEVNILDPNALISNPFESLPVNESNIPVTAVMIDNKNMRYMPKNIGEIFIDLVALRVKNNKLSELSKNDLKSMPKLRYLNLDENDIEVLEDDVFENNPELELVWLRSNKIKKIGENLVESFKKLLSLDLADNTCTNKKFALLQSSHATPSSRSIQNKFIILTEIMQSCANFTETILEVDVRASEDDHPDLKEYKNQINSLNSQLTGTKMELKLLKQKFVEEMSAKNKTLDMLYELQNNHTLLTNEVEINNSQKSITELEIKLKQEEKEVRNLKDELKKLRGIYEEFTNVKARIKSYENEKYIFTQRIEQNQAEIRALHAANAKLREENERLQKQIQKTDTEYEVEDPTTTTTTLSPSFDVRASETTKSALEWEPESSTNATETTSNAPSSSESNDIDKEWGQMTPSTQKNLNEIGRSEFDEEDDDGSIERTTIYDYYN